MTKTKRILSTLLGLALTLLPTAAFAMESIKTVAVTVSDLVWGKPRPSIGSVSVVDTANLQVTNMAWATNDGGNVGVYDRISVTVEIKPGVDAKFAKETSVKATINGESNGIMKKRASDTQFVLAYTIQLKDHNAAEKRPPPKLLARQMSRRATTPLTTGPTPTSTRT